MIFAKSLGIVTGTHFCKTRSGVEIHFSDAAKPGVINPGRAMSTSPVVFFADARRLNGGCPGKLSRCRSLLGDAPAPSLSRTEDRESIQNGGCRLIQSYAVIPRVVPFSLLVSGGLSLIRETS